MHFVPRWHHFKMVCFHSITVAWSYAMFLLAMAGQALITWPDISNSLGLTAYIPPKYAPAYMFGIAALTLVARLRSILWHQEVRDVNSGSGIYPPTA